MYVRNPADMMSDHVYAPISISVIESDKESYEEYHQRKNREQGRKRVPFGFGIREEEGKR